MTKLICALWQAAQLRTKFIVGVKKFTADLMIALGPNRVQMWVFDSQHVGERSIFCPVVELLRIDCRWRVSLLPRDCPAYCLRNRSRLLVVQLGADALRSRNDMLCQVPRHQ